MKRQWLFVMAALFFVVGLALMLTAPAQAAELANLSDPPQSCGDFEGTWHFVNNQTGGAAAGTLTATFSSGDGVCVLTKVLTNTQHFDCTASGTLVSASTNLPGRLVLSDFTCEEKTEEPPPPK